MSHRLRFLGFYVMVSVGCAALILLGSFPHHPHTGLGWALLLVVAFPATLLGELLGHFALHNSLARAIESRSGGVGFWFVRYAYLLLVVMLAVAGSWAVFYFVSPLNL